MSNILAFDTSTQLCSAVLLTHDRYFEECTVAPKRHGELILPMIDSLFKQAGIGLADISLLAFGQGPGAFTGLRIAASIAQGIAYAVDLAVIPISTLQAMAQEAFSTHHCKRVVTCLDARMNEVYAGQYELNADNIMSSIIEDCLISPEKLSSLFTTSDQYVVGNGWSNDTHPFHQNTPITLLSDIMGARAKFIAQLAAYYQDKKKLLSALEVEPVYLRDKVTSA